MIFAFIGEVTQQGVTLILPTAQTATKKKYNCLASYTPAAGDRVAVIENGGTLLVLGKLKY